MFYSKSWSKSSVSLVCWTLAFFAFPLQYFSDLTELCFHHLPCTVAGGFPYPHVVFLCTGFFLETQNHPIFWFIRDLWRLSSLIPLSASVQSCSPDNQPPACNSFCPTCKTLHLVLLDFINFQSANTFILSKFSWRWFSTQSAVCKRMKEIFGHLLLNYRQFERDLAGINKS